MLSSETDSGPAVLATDSRMVRPGGTSAAFVLAELRVAALRARLVAAEIDMVGVALRGGLLGPDDAVHWLDQLDHGANIGGASE
jgi:hypothetical protein